MKTQELDIETIMAARRKSLAQTLRQVTIEELNALLPILIPYPSHPWRDKFQQFLNENRSHIFHEGIVDEGVHVIFCRAQDKGIWYLPEAGIGLLDTGWLAALKDWVDDTETSPLQTVSC